MLVSIEQFYVIEN